MMSFHIKAYFLAIWKLQVWFIVMSKYKSFLPKFSSFSWKGKKLHTYIAAIVGTVLQISRLKWNFITHILVLPQVAVYLSPFFIEHSQVAHLLFFAWNLLTKGTRASTFSRGVQSLNVESGPLLLQYSLAQCYLRHLCLPLPGLLRIVENIILFDD